MKYLFPGMSSLFQDDSVFIERIGEITKWFDEFENDDKRVMWPSQSWCLSPEVHRAHIEIHHLTDYLCWFFLRFVNHFYTFKHNQFINTVCHSQIFQPTIFVLKLDSFHEHFVSEFIFSFDEQSAIQSCRLFITFPNIWQNKFSKCFWAQVD